MIEIKHNPLLTRWTGPHGGSPPFDSIRPDHFIPALEAAIAMYREELANVASCAETPSFSNTLEALELAGETYRRVSALFGIYTSVMNDAAMQQVQMEGALRQAAFQDSLVQDGRLFDRVRNVFENRFDAGLSVEQIRLAEYYYNDLFVRNGAALNDDDKQVLAELHQDLARLATQFAQNVMADEQDRVLELDQHDLSGLPADLIAGAAALAAERGVTGKWLIANTRGAIDAFLTYSPDPDLRAKAFAMWRSRGDYGDDHDNVEIVSSMLRLRHQKARLLGFRSYAHWVADGAMAGTPEAIEKLLLEIWKPALARVRAEINELQLSVQLEASDARYFFEIERQKRFDFSEEELKPYLQLQKLREGLFWIAGELFGLTFERVTDLPVYHPDVEIFAVKRQHEHVGLWYFDLYARPGKASGAWMSEYRGQQRLGAVTPIVSNNANFVKAAPGEASLISWLEATMLFHEFGHGLHSMLSNVCYPSLAGTKVPRDFVELPSQLFERWLSAPELLSCFALHYRTAEPMPPALLSKLRDAHNFRSGFNMVELVACALLDQEAHGERGDERNAQTIESEVLNRLEMPPAIALRHRLPHFTHLFSSEGYAAGYYSYIWADVLTADGAEAFAAAPWGLFDPAVAKRFLKQILSVGNSVDPAEAYRRFRGREPSLRALLRDRGFA